MSGPTTDAEIGARVRMVRQARKLTQQQVADRITGAGHMMDNSAVSRTESGGRPLLARELIALAAVLGVTPAALLGGSAAAPDELTAALRERVGQLELIRERYDKICRLAQEGAAPE